MKILHTSDWHLGRSLYGRKRYQEYAAFLDWLVETIEAERVEALLVAGDVFDTSTPSNRAQELYYRFLCRVSGSCCRHVVVIAGNHDSPSFLNAPRELLRALQVHVVGSISSAPEDEVIPLVEFSGGVADPDRSAIICAIPYLRDKDIRVVEPGETIEDKNRKLVEGVKDHYAEVAERAEQKRIEIYQQSINNQQSKIQNHQSSITNHQSNVPIVAMGHLFTAGGRTVEGDGVRELYVGSLVHVNRDAFPTSIDYLALGHLHVPQAVGGTEHMRYSGSPLPMSFGEADQVKSVVIVDFRYDMPDSSMNGSGAIRKSASNHLQSKIKLLPVPCFQRLVRIAGSLDDITARLEILKKEDSRAWLEIDYTGDRIVNNLRDMLDEAVAGTAMEILRIKNRCVTDRVINAAANDETLDDLDTGDVFARCLEAHEVPDEDRKELTAAYGEVIQNLAEDDPHAE